MRKFGLLFALALILSSFSFAGDCDSCNCDFQEVEIATDVEMDVACETSFESSTECPCPEAECSE